MHVCVIVGSLRSCVYLFVFSPSQLSTFPGLGPALMHILAFIHHYHTPDCATAVRPYSLVRHLARNHDVTLITTDAWRSRRHTDEFQWVPDNVRLIEYDVTYRNAMGTSERVIAFAKFAARALADGIRGTKPDVIFATSTPLSTGLVGALVARWHRVPWVFEVRDLWPDFPIQMGALRSPVLRSLLYRLESFLYRNASHVIGLSPDMTDHVQQIAPQTAASTVLYGSDLDFHRAVSDEDVARMRAIAGKDAPMTVLYAGSFGRANAIPSLIEVARKLQHRSDIRFVMTGEGYHAETVRQAERALDNLTRIPPLPHHQAVALFAAADVSLVSFADVPVLSSNSPGKLFDSLAAGTPVVVTNPGWTADVVRENRCGWVVPPEDVSAMAKTLVELRDRPQTLQEASTNALEIGRKRLQRSQAVKEIERVLLTSVVNEIS